MLKSIAGTAVVLGLIHFAAAPQAYAKCVEPKGNAVTLKQYDAWEDCVKRELDKEDAERKAKDARFKEPSKKKMTSAPDKAPTVTGDGASKGTGGQR